MRKLSATIFLFALIATLSADAALAQQADSLAQQPPTIFVTSWQCDTAALSNLVDMAREQDLPIFQELVNEGKLWSYSVMVHRWGDEWNYVTFTVADDVAAGVAANTDFGTRAEERYGEDETLLEHCKTHRDNIYVGVYITQDPEGQDVKPPYSLSMSYFACPIKDLDEIVAASRDTFLPAAQASVNEGKGYWTGAMRHAWADEWNYVILRGAEDVPGLIAFAFDTGQRIAAPDGPAPTASCAHKDNIYQMVLATEDLPQE